MADPKPVMLTQIAADDFAGNYAPEPMLVVGDIPGITGGLDAAVAALIADTDSATYAAIDALINP